MLYCVSFFLVMRRPPRSTLSSSSAASDVYKRQVSTQSTGKNGNGVMEESEAWGTVASDAAELNRQMDAALADISTLRKTVARLPDRHQPYIPQPVTTLPAIRAPEPRTIIRRSSVAGRSRKASQCDRERLLAELNKAGTGALDKLPGVVVLEVLPSKRCVHFGTVVAGAVQPSTSTVIEAKGGGAELKLGEKARGYALLLAQHAEQISSNDVPCVLRRVARVRRGKREHAYDVVAMQRPSRVPKWIRNPLQGPRQKLEELEEDCLLYTSPSPRDRTRSRMPSSA
eukprot:TRINITY_DN1094_c0_g1_i2.p1 TRINITY_DN1094_c0_g1~~TRINITY_DN1094_c0_g1_i2.p1  ORF type:complete len:285 (-),score=40.84 TRINITY_DN1094_c0_g1_i2:29-883(-)